MDTSPPHTPVVASGALPSAVPPFSSYQKLLVVLLATLQFTIILDFMILSPLGALLMPELQLSPRQFGFVVSAYAFSAGTSGFLASGFADRFDRKKFLMVFYSGFVVGTFLCGLANSYVTLLMARIVTGFFGGVVGSIGFAIITDLFLPSMRGRVMGFIQSAFAASQILGIPVGLYLSNHWGWHAPFLVLVGFGVLLGIVVMTFIKPVTGHLKTKVDKSPFHHLLGTLSERRYLQAFATTALLSTGGFMLMPFGSAFSVRNLGLTMADLPFVYLVTGLCSIVAGPLVGRLADAWGSFKVFTLGSLLTLVTVIVYTHLGITPIHQVILVSVMMFVGVSARMISSQALLSTIPAPTSRGSFMSVNASVQQMSGGLAAIVAGWIVVAPETGPLQNFDIVGFVVVGTTLTTLALMRRLSRVTTLSSMAT